MFCHKQTGKAFMMFNKQLTEEKFNDLRNKIEIEFKKVRWTNGYDILQRLDEKEKTCLGEELELVNDGEDIESRKEAWKPVLEELKQLTKLNIWDNDTNEVVEKITGWDLNKEPIKTELYSKETIENAKRILKDVGEL